MGLNGVSAAAKVQDTTFDKVADEGDAFLREREQEVTALRTDLLEKNEHLLAIDDRLKSAIAEVARLTSELDGSAELLNECQVGR